MSDFEQFWQEQMEKSNKAANLSPGMKEQLKALAKAGWDAALLTLGDKIEITDDVLDVQNKLINAIAPKPKPNTDE